MVRLFSDRRGVTAAEYALLAGAISLALIAVLRVPAQSLAELLAQLLASAGPGSTHR